MLQEIIAGTNVSFNTTTGLSLHGRAGAFRIGKQKVTNANFNCQFHAKRKNKNILTFWQTFQNNSDQNVNLTDIHIWQGNLTTQNASQASAWQVAHTQNFRTDHYFNGYSAYQGSLLEPLHRVTGTLGLSEDSPFPGLAFTHPNHGSLLLATITQNCCKPLFDIQHQNKKTSLALREHFDGIPHITIAPGNTFTTEKWVAIFHPGSLEDALDLYFQKLRTTLDFAGENSILQKAVVWGSWNFNDRKRGHGDITHDYITQNAKALKKLCPRKPAFVMIDDGYQRDRSKLKTTRNAFASSLEFFYPSPKTAHDPKLFPKGMKGIADAIRKQGVKPALWMTPRLHRNSQLALEKPHWLIQLNKPYDYTPKTAFLDYSLPEVRDYFHLVWDTIFNVWGFDGIKLDFWTMAYEIPGLAYRNQSQTAIELRQQFLKDIRAFVPKNGFLLTACAVNSGNPYIGQYVDAARVSIDIGDGDINHIIQSATAGTGILPFLRYNTMLPDLDSVGRWPANTENLNRLWATFATVAGGMCEIAGDLSNLHKSGLDPSGQPNKIARDFFLNVIKFHKPAIAARMDIATRSQNSPPSYLRRDFQDGSSYEGHFNWRGMRREIHLDHPGTDLWTNHRIKTSHMIPAYDAILIKRPAKH